MADESKTKPGPGAGSKPGDKPTDAPKIDPILGSFGAYTFSHEASVTLYPSKTDANVMNGRAGHVHFVPREGMIVSASIYVDVTKIDKDGRAATQKSYKLSWPKGAKVSFATKAAESKFKALMLRQWADARKAKQATGAADTGVALVEVEVE